MVLKREYEPVFKPNDAYFCTDTNSQILGPLISSEEAEHSMKKADEMRDMFGGWSTNAKMGLGKQSNHWTLCKQKDEGDSPDSIMSHLHRKR